VIDPKTDDLVIVQFNTPDQVTSMMTISTSPKPLLYPHIVRFVGLAFCGLISGIPSIPKCAADEAVSGLKTYSTDDSDMLKIEGTVVDENDAPVPKTRVRLYTYALKGAVPTTLADEHGHFQFSVDLATARYLTFVADGLKNGTKAYAHISEEGTLGLPIPLKLVLKPPRILDVDVHDADGNPIADAHVEASAMYTSLAFDRSESDGTVRLKLPADAIIDCALALKSGRGFDYWTSMPKRGADAEVCPEKLTLTLNGARRVRVRAIDSAGQPVSGIKVTPWSITKQGKSFYANLSGGLMSPLVNSNTDAQGIATVDWIPTDFANSITFLMGSKDYHLPQSPAVTPDMKEEDELTMNLFATTLISGTVLSEDGTAAAGIVVQAEGRGATNHYYRDVARTNAAGRFEFKAFPNQAYLIAVLNDHRTAASLTLPELQESQPIDDLELRLGSGTAVRGVVTDAAGKIRKNEAVTLVQNAQAPGANPINVSLVRWAHTDNEGRYHFLVGPGTFDLMDPGHKQKIQLTIKSQDEVIQDFSTQ